MRDFPRLRTVMINSDGGSTDGTPELIRAHRSPKRDRVQTSHSLRTFHRVVAPYHGLPGKLTALRTIFAAAELTQAKALVVVDPGGPATEPDRVTELITPIVRGEVEFLAPRYRRHPRDGVLVTQLVRPMVRAVYGVGARRTARRRVLRAQDALPRIASNRTSGSTKRRGLRSTCGCAPKRSPSGFTWVRSGGRRRPRRQPTTLREAVRQVVLSLIVSLRAHEVVLEDGQRRRPTAHLGRRSRTACPTPRPGTTQALAEQARHDIGEIRPLLEEVLDAGPDRAA